MNLTPIASHLPSVYLRSSQSAPKLQYSLKVSSHGLNTPPSYTKYTYNKLSTQLVHLNYSFFEKFTNIRFLSHKNFDHISQEIVETFGNIEFLSRENFNNISREIVERFVNIEFLSRENLITFMKVQIVERLKFSSRLSTNFIEIFEKNLHI